MMRKSAAVKTVGTDSNYGKYDGQVIDRTDLIEGGADRGTDGHHQNDSGDMVSHRFVVKVGHVRQIDSAQQQYNNGSTLYMRT